MTSSGREDPLVADLGQPSVTLRTTPSPDYYAASGPASLLSPFHPQTPWDLSLTFPLSPRPASESQIPPPLHSSPRLPRTFRLIP